MKNTACSGNGYKTAQKQNAHFLPGCVLEKPLLSLCRTKGWNGVNVSAIAKRSGVSRMTFYITTILFRALTDYMKEIVADYLKARKNTPGLGNYQEYSHVVFLLNSLISTKPFF